MALDWNFYLNLICSVGGIAFFVYSLFLLKKIKNILPVGKITHKWRVIQGLIVLFLFGYVFNVIFLALNVIFVVTIMTAIVYLFGGLFVLLIINLTYKTYKLVLLESEE